MLAGQASVHRPQTAQGVAVEKLLLGEVAHVCRAEDLGGLEVERRGEGPRRFERAEDEGEWSADEVYVLGQRNVDGEPQDYAGVCPPRDGMERAGEFRTQAGAGQQIAKGGSDDCCRSGAGTAGGDVHGLGEDRKQHQRGDEQEDDC